jgi:N-acetylglucosamine-6-sulfatase
MPVVQHEIVKRGVEFQNGFVTTSLCCPSRASILTGRYAHNHGVLTNAPPRGGAPLFDPTFALPVWLHAAGYQTGLFGKYMNAYYLIAPGVPPGWDAWQAFVQDGPLYFDYTVSENGVAVKHGHQEEDYSTDVMRDRTLAFIEQNARRPFFALFAPFAPHDPAIPAPRHVGRFAGVPPWRPPNWEEPDVSLKPVWVQFQKAITQADRSVQTDQLRIGMLESLLAVDEAVAALLARLEQLGLADDTMVIFLSDNGLHLLEHWWTFKETLYEEAIRVPFAIRYPALVPLGRRADELVANIDLAPTIAAVAGATVPGPVDGASLVPLLDGSAAGWRTDLLFENFVTFLILPSSAVRTDRWKYIHTETTFGIADELYDLQGDPYELVNLAFDPGHAALLAALSARLAELEAQ